MVMSELVNLNAQFRSKKFFFDIIGHFISILQLN